MRETKAARADLHSSSASLRAELEQRTAESAAGNEAALARLGEATERVDSALAEITVSEQRLLEIEGQMRGTGAKVVQAAARAADAADLEARLRGATRAEEEAARRIREAEERLRERLDED
jgi:hypothetical protein